MAIRSMHLMRPMRSRGRARAAAACALLACIGLGASAASAAPTAAAAQARAPEPARLRVTASKAALLERCGTSASTSDKRVKGTLERDDELIVVRKVDADWYRVRLAANPGVEGCVSAKDVAPIAASATDTPERTKPGTTARQPRPGTTPRLGGPRRDGFGVSGFVDVGSTFFSAKDSFEAVLDTSSGAIFGGGAQVQLPYNLFARFDVTRFRKDGQRVFVSNGEVFPLGIDTTITVTPIEFTGGYRRELVFGRRGPRPGPGRSDPRGAGGFRLIPFAGGGVGVVRYSEKADFAESGDDVDESFTSYHIIGGVEVPIWRWVGVGAEYHHRWVPDALGDSGVSKEFDETDLGGGTFRVRFIVSF